MKIRETTQWFFENLQHQADQNCYFNRGDGFAVQEFSGDWDIADVNDERFHSGICTFDGWFNERAWISPGLTHQIEEIFMLHYDANGVLDQTSASSFLSGYFQGKVDIKPLISISIQKMNELTQTTSHLCHHIEQYLSDVKVAKTLKEIKAGIGATCSLDSMKQEISTLMRTGQINSLGKRGLYIASI